MTKEKWEEKSRIEFEAAYPRTAREAHKIELTEDGDVYVHYVNTTYPHHYRNAITPYEEVTQ